MSMMILKCYSQISLQKGKDIKNTEEPIDILSDENKNLLGVELWGDIYAAGDKEEIVNEISSLQPIIEAIKFALLFVIIYIIFIAHNII